jgi:hypothetical protein
MKILFGRFLVACVLLVATGSVFAGPFKSRIIKHSPLEISVPDDHFLRIWNFTQVGGVDRGAVTVTIDRRSTNVLTASRVDTISSGGVSQNPSEIVNQVIIAGPAQVTIAPVLGATLLITYRKEFNEDSDTSSADVTPTSTPISTVTPTPSPTP